MSYELKEKKEYHDNGQLAYEETIGMIERGKEYLYPSRRQLKNGPALIRVGRVAKYYNNSQIAWLLNYDENGQIIKENNPAYRKDGSVIMY